MRTELDRSKQTQPGSNKSEAFLWAFGALAAFAWTYSLGFKLFSKFEIRGATVTIEAFLLRNSGHTALLIATVLISLVAFSAVIQALRGRALPPRAASVVLVTSMALRAIQIAAQGSAQIADAQILAGLMLLAAVAYWGATRLWWLVLMPLATVSMFSPLIWLEFFKGASHAILIQAVTAPAVAFGLSALLIVSRELRMRAEHSFVEMDRIQARGVTLKKQMHGMETDLKSLLSMISISRPAVLVQETAGQAQAQSQSQSQVQTDVALAPIEALGETSFVDAPVGPVTTTEFVAASEFPANASSYEEIDRVAREVLDEARLKVEGKKIRLLLTAPVGASVPLSVNGEASSVARWIRALVANSLDSVGGFPDGVVRVTLRPGLTSLMISIEDNGRGFNDDLLTKLGASQEGRMSSQEVKREVEAIKGRFDVQARLGVGSRLSIELLRVDRAQEQKSVELQRDPRSLQAFKGIQNRGGFRPSSSNSPRV